MRIAVPCRAADADPPQHFTSGKFNSRSLVFGFRRILADTRTNTREVRKLLAKELPELGEREQLRIEAVIRCLVSTQAWLRMREEFGVPGPSRARWWRE